MVSRIFISWICHFWAWFWLNFNFGDFRAYFGYFSLVKIDFFEIYFQSWRIKLRVLKFFRPILIIKRHQKNTQAKLFEKFASRQHALMVRSTMRSFTPWCAQSAKRPQRFTRQSAKWWGINECKAITVSSEHITVPWICFTFHEYIHVYTKWEQTPNKHHCSATQTWRIFKKNSLCWKEGWTFDLLR